VAVVLIGAIYGAIIGSYLSCALWRIPQHRSLLGRSICAVCQQQLRGIDNVPIFAWLWLRGRSDCCQQPISIRYPLYETGSATIGAAIAGIFGLLVTGAVMIGIILATVIASLATGVRPTVADQPQSALLRPEYLPPAADSDLSHYPPPLPPAAPAWSDYPPPELIAGTNIKRKLIADPSSG
jgi:hypothetical protein